jgi:hypothetical protein
MKSIRTILVAGVMMIAAVFAVQAQTSAQVVISGTVTPVLTLAIDFTDTTINLTSTAEQSLGKMTLKSNYHNGYTVTVSSANAGLLKGIKSGNTDTFGYSFKLGTDSRSSLALAQLFTFNDRTPKAGSEFSVSITLDSVEGETDFVANDLYSDTLTFTISAP